MGEKKLGRNHILRLALGMTREDLTKHGWASLLMFFLMCAEVLVLKKTSAMSKAGLLLLGPLFLAQLIVRGHLVLSTTARSLKQELRILIQRTPQLVYCVIYLGALSLIFFAPFFLVEKILFILGQAEGRDQFPGYFSDLKEFYLFSGTSYFVCLSCFLCRYSLVFPAALLSKENGTGIIAKFKIKSEQYYKDAFIIYLLPVASSYLFARFFLDKKFQLIGLIFKIVTSTVFGVLYPLTFKNLYLLDMEKEGSSFVGRRARVTSLKILIFSTVFLFLFLNIVIKLSLKFLRSA